MFWVLAILAVSACSITLSRSHMMEPYRKIMELTHDELGYLARCHYCTSHWVAAAVVAVYRPVVGGLFWPDLFLGWLALVGGAAIVSVIILWFMPMLPASVVTTGDEEENTIEKEATT